MALPVILVDAATGSDSTASGAGPAVALTGSAASTSAGGTVVTLDGSPDLSGVATDGSHAIFLSAPTGRVFGSIVAKDNTAKTVTVTDAFAGSGSGMAWAIGGKRASIGAASSRKLFDNNSSAGDAMPGWTVQMQSGHVESIGSQIMFRRSGNNLTDGAIVLRGENGGTRPIITFTHDGSGFTTQSAQRILCDYFEVRNSNASKTASVAFDWAGSLGSCSFHLRRIQCNHSTDTFYRFCDICGVVDSCDVRYCVNSGIRIAPSGNRAGVCINTYVYATGGTGIAFASGGDSSAFVFGNIVNGCNQGMNLSHSGNCNVVMHNTLYGNATSGIRLFSANGRDTLFLINNIFANNLAYGIDYAVASPGLYGLMLSRNNAFWNNTSGVESVAGMTEDPIIIDPQFTDPANHDFTIGPNLTDAGWPVAPEMPLGLSNTMTYLDIGAAQRETNAMPDGVTAYNIGKKEILAGTAGTLKAMLVKDTYVFDPDHDFASEVSTHEAAGSARQTLSGVVATADDTLDAGVLDADDLILPADAGQDVNAVVVYREVTNDADSILRYYIPITPTTTNGASLNVQFTLPVSGGMAYVL